MIRPPSPSPSSYFDASEVYFAINFLSVQKSWKNFQFSKANFFLHTLHSAWLQRSNLVFKIKRQFFLKTFQIVSFSRKPSLHVRRSKRKGKGIRARELPLPLLTPATQATVNPEQKNYDSLSRPCLSKTY